MFKYIALLVLVIATGCQTTTSPEGVSSTKRGSMPGAEKSEKLLLRADKIVDTYSVSVQRVELNGTNPKQTDQWGMVASVEVSGYPNSFRKSEGSTPPDSAQSKGTYLLDGTAVEIALAPGVQLIVKVIPKMQNTARIVGVFTQTRATPAGAETFSLPFDVECDLGKVVVLYQKDLALAATVEP